jgi:transposase
VTSHSLYQWIRRYRVPEAERLVTEDQNAELRRLKAELRRVSEEHDILKKVAVYFAKKGWLFLAVVIDLFSRQVIGW